MLRFNAALALATCTLASGPNYKTLLATMTSAVVTTVDLDKMNMIAKSVLMTSGFFVERNTSIRLAVHGNPTTGY